MRRIDSRYFSGGAHLQGAGDDALAAIIRDFAIRDAKRTIVTAAVAALTDNSGGAAADGVIAAITFPAATVAIDDPGNCVAKTEYESALATVKDAYMEIAEKVVALEAVLPTADLTNNIGGTAADGTIAVIDVTLADAFANLVSRTGALALHDDYQNVVATLAWHINRLRVAVGLAPITDNSGGEVLWTANGASTIPALATSTGTAVAVGGSSITEDHAEALMTAYAAQIKELATAANAVRAVTAPATAVTVAA